MSARLNIGLIGSGFMGQAHADAYRRAAMFYPDLPKRPHLYALAVTSRIPPSKNWATDRVCQPGRGRCRVAGSGK